jgi:hypothetical protein
MKILDYLGIDRKIQGRDARRYAHDSEVQNSDLRPNDPALVGIHRILRVCGKGP